MVRAVTHAALQRASIAQQQAIQRLPTTSRVLSTSRQQPTGVQLSTPRLPTGPQLAAPRPSAFVQLSARPSTAGVQVSAGARVMVRPQTQSIVPTLRRPSAVLTPTGSVPIIKRGAPVRATPTPTTTTAAGTTTRRIMPIQQIIRQQQQQKSIIQQQQQQQQPQQPSTINHQLFIRQQQALLQRQRPQSSPVVGLTLQQKGPRLNTNTMQTVPQPQKGVIPIARFPSSVVPRPPGILPFVMPPMFAPRPVPTKQTVVKVLRPQPNPIVTTPKKSPVRVPSAPVREKDQVMEQMIREEADWKANKEAPAKSQPDKAADEKVSVEKKAAAVAEKSGGGDEKKSEE
eukprot:NODE_753_length_1367_cov_153.540212_g568_i0.p1 GENE.NODE_753_length_1367_cov_153.540212_g568_i0~~NODE_753_length_1367_cov_153.540212_g568_i0.p1  ORF type:complete len:343 (-),score=98.34 NODE_753_length_1367_cov_153.540212_g568_i0:185-1213(-)